MLEDKICFRGLRLRAHFGTRMFRHVSTIHLGQFYTPIPQRYDADSTGTDLPRHAQRH